MSFAVLKLFYSCCFFLRIVCNSSFTNTDAQAAAVSVLNRSHCLCLGLQDGWRIISGNCLTIYTDGTLWKPQHLFNEVSLMSNCSLHYSGFIVGFCLFIN